MQKDKSKNASSGNEVGSSLLWDMLPGELESYFVIDSYSKTDTKYVIHLTEKNIVPIDLPERYHGKRIINSYTREMTIDDFPIRGRKCEIILNRRAWKFEGVPEIYHRDLEICAAGTKLNKEFGAFLKEVGGQGPLTDKYYSQV